MTTIRKWFASLLAVTMCVSLLAIPAAAYARVDVDKSVTLTMTFKKGDTPLVGMPVRIYKVFDMTDAARIAVVEAFEGETYQAVGLAAFAEDYNAGGGTITQKDWAAYASTLKGLIGKDTDIVPTEAALSDATGKVAFGTDVKLTAGIYLLTGDKLEVGRYTYTPQTYLVALPNLDVETDEWVYDVTAATNKYGEDYDAPSTKVTRSVKKVWDDADSDVERPASVSVQLLRNGEVYETVKLDKDNDWQHTWSGLRKSDTWTLVEIDVPTDYTVLVTESGKTFTVTNTATVELPPVDPPIGPPIDPPVDPPIDPPDVDVPDSDVPTTGLPQTGMLWWPVQVLTVAGLLLFCVGWIDLKRGRKN